MKWVWFLLALLLILSSCGDGGALTLDQVVQMAEEKGEALDWADFDGYDYEETGSGLYIRIYEIDERYHVAIGGSYHDEPAWYMTLFDSMTGDHVDLRTGDVEQFLAE